MEIRTMADIANDDANELADKKELATIDAHKDLDRWYSAELGDELIDIDTIISNDILCHDDAVNIIKLMLTGHGVEGLIKLAKLYAKEKENRVDEMIEAHFYKD